MILNSLGIVYSDTNQRKRGQRHEYAGIIKDIVSIGVSNRIEIWSKEKWDESLVLGYYRLNSSTGTTNILYHRKKRS